MPRRSHSNREDPVHPPAPCQSPGAPVGGTQGGLRAAPRPGRRGRPRRLARLLLLAVTTAVVLVLAEVAVRAVDGYALDRVRLVRGPVTSSTAAGASTLVREFLEAMGPQTADDGRLFASSPPPVPQHALDPEQTRRVTEHGTPTAFWFNESLLRQLWIRGEGIASLRGRRQPDWYWTFLSPDGGAAPRYRYPPSSTLVTGLTTNSLGFRGRELPRSKAGDVVRIACVGASTTADAHDLPHCYPDLLEHFLGEWGREAELPVRFEVVNAGCEGYMSADIRATVRHYLLPLEVDYVVYYEGANHFFGADLGRNVTFLEQMPRPDVRPLLVGAEDDGLLAGAGAWSALARRAKAALDQTGPALAEPRKPAQHIALPEGLSLEDEPVLARAGEVLSLGRILGDLDGILAELRSHDGRLVLCSFRWFVRDGLLLDPVHGAATHRHLNGSLWPCSYATLRSLADLQNRWFAAWARRHGVDFLDVAAWLPLDQRLYTDAIHSTPLGVRMHAWAAFCGMRPLLERDLAAGAVPRAGPVARAAGGGHAGREVPRIVTREQLDRGGG